MMGDQLKLVRIIRASPSKQQQQHQHQICCLTRGVVHLPSLIDVFFTTVSRDLLHGVVVRSALSARQVLANQP